ncbi:ArnT family glycosyltransferase [Singulisphaera sp. PoT]|uniref:ArnT family glycosyltransferase n=1 Tax=Singulisphaera sp. PoT TaxID=3411797 RepID=UPI003BF60F0B
MREFLGTRRAVWWLILLGAAPRLMLAAAIGPGNDESYHYLYAVNADLSYLDHPPMVALLESAGLALVKFHASAFAMRIGTILTFAGSTWLMARMTARYYGALAGWLAAFAFNVDAYHGIACSSFVLPDGPLTFFWLLTLDRLLIALESPAKLRPWIWVGLAWGGAMLSKYQAVFLPIGTLVTLWLDGRCRRVLSRWGPYLAFAIGLILFSPVVYWNATNDWVSFSFQGGRALGGSGPRPDLFLGFIAAQAAYLFPWVWIPLALVLFHRLRDQLNGRTVDPWTRFFMVQALVPILAFTSVALVRPVLPHWAQVGYLGAFPLLGRAWSSRWASGPRRNALRAAFLGSTWLSFIILLCVHTNTGILQFGGHRLLGMMPVSRDPTLDFYGWDQILRELRHRGLVEGSGTFLFSDRWYLSSHLAFVTENRLPVTCFNRRHAQGFALWSRSNEWVGRDGIYVGLDDCRKSALDISRWFRRFESLGTFPVLRKGVPVREVHLYRGITQIAPFPFGEKFR